MSSVLPPDSRRSSAVHHTLIILCFASIALGIFLRLHKTERKLVWFDEVYTSFYATGNTPWRFLTSFPKRVNFPIARLTAYQSAAENKGLRGLFRALIETDPQHGPLYFLLLWPWSKTFGAQPAALRFPTALLSLLGFPALAWFSYEAFRKRSAVLTLLCLFSLSPFHILYSQEARPYALWTVLVLFNGAAFLRAMRGHNWGPWVLYSATTLAMQSTQLLSAPLLLAHGAVMLTERNSEKKRPQLLRWLIAAAAAEVLFAPWWIIVALKINQISGALGHHIRSNYFSWEDYLLRTIKDFSCIIFDPGLFADGEHQVPVLCFFIGCIVLLAGFLFSLKLMGDRARRMFAATMLLFYLPLAINDVLRGGSATLTPRYLTPFYLYLLLGFGYLLACGLESELRAVKIMSLIALGATLGISLGSSIKIHRADVWWNKGIKGHDGAHVIEMLKTLNSPLVLSTNEEFCNLFDIIALADRMPPETKFQLLDPLDTGALSPRVKNLLFFNATDTVVEGYKHRFALTRLDQVTVWNIWVGSR